MVEINSHQVVLITRARFLRYEVLKMSNMVPLLDDPTTPSYIIRVYFFIIIYLLHGFIVLEVAHPLYQVFWDLPPIHPRCPADFLYGLLLLALGEEPAS